MLSEQEREQIKALLSAKVAEHYHKLPDQESGSNAPIFSKNDVVDILELWVNPLFCLGIPNKTNSVAGKKEEL